MLLKPVQVEYYQNRAAQMCSFLTEIKFCCSHRHSGSHWLPFLFPGRVNLQKTNSCSLYEGKNLIPSLPSSRPPHSEHEPQVYHAQTRVLNSLQVWTAVNLTWWTHGIFCKPWISDSTINEWFIWHSKRSKNTNEYCLFSIQFKVDRLQIIC